MMSPMHFLVLGLLLAIAALTNSSSAQAEAFPFNGHFYEFFQLTENISWKDARAAALSTTSKGKCGYLVNITSAEENEFVLSITPDTWDPGTPLLNDGWIGATDKDLEGDWIWADGSEGGMVFWRGDASGSLVEPFVYENWGTIKTGDNDEPNDYMVLFPGGEDYAHLQGSYGWNDLPNIERTPRRGYFVEYDGLIDIKPGKDPNRINICAKGNISVAIFSCNNFDATQVDPTTVRFAGAGVKLDKKGNPVIKIQDANDDGLSDMVAKFEIPELVLDSEDAEATLTGMTVGGMEIEGLDAVEVKQQMCVRTLE